LPLEFIDPGTEIQGHSIADHPLILDVGVPIAELRAAKHRGVIEPNPERRAVEREDARYPGF